MEQQFNSLIEEEILEEGRIANLAASAMLGLGLMTTPVDADAAKMHYQQQHPVTAKKSSVMEKRKQLDDAKHTTLLASAIRTKYTHVTPELAHQIATSAKKHADPVFPKAEDILAVVGVESSHDPRKISGLKVDPARGLMQVRPETHGLGLKDLKTVDQQIGQGAAILKDYYGKLGENKEKALHAYNIGPSNVKQGKRADEYVAKVKEEKKIYTANASKKKTT